MRWLSAGGANNVESAMAEETIRDARESDLDAIVRIYNASIPSRLATADTEFVSVESRHSWFRDRDPSHHPIWAAELAGTVAGWLSFGKFYGRPAYAATAEVSIYVDPGCQRAGIATQLLEAAFRRSHSLGLTTLLVFVFAHNEPSIALCGKFGFQQWGLLPRVAVLDSVDRDLLILGRRVDEFLAESKPPADPVFHPGVKAPHGAALR